MSAIFGQSLGVREHDEAGTRFRERLLALLTDWGRGLDLALYTEAMIHFMGGKSRVAQRLPLSCGDQRLGTQDFNMLNSETAFRLTAFTDEPETWRESLHALLVLSPLQRLQWVNLGRQEIRFVTVER